MKAAAAAGGFPRVPNGCGGVGERMVVSHTLAVATGKMSPARWIETCCARPAEMMGLAGRKGRLAPGFDADIVLFDPDRRIPLGTPGPKRPRRLPVGRTAGHRRRARRLAARPPGRRRRAA